MRLGEWNTTSERDCDQRNLCADPVKDIGVAEVFVHESYDPSSLSRENDIALIRLQNKVDFSEFIRPICLPLSGTLRTKSYDGETLTAAGWGFTEAGK